MSKPYADRLDQYERHLADPTEQARWVAACRGNQTTPIAAAYVLRVLVSRTNPSTGTVSETHEQIAAGCPFVGPVGVKRAMRVLRELGTIEQCSPGHRGRAAVHRVTFLAARTAEQDTSTDSGEGVDNQEIGVPVGTPNQSIGVPESRIGVPPEVPLHGIPHGKTPRTSVDNSTAPPPPDRERGKRTDQWVAKLLTIAESRNAGFTPKNRTAYRDKKREHALTLLDRWGNLDLDAHGSDLADVLNSKTAGERAHPTLYERLDQASSTREPRLLVAVGSGR